MMNAKQPDQVYLACCATDLRRSIDGLAALVKMRFRLDPFSNCLFAFCNQMSLFNEAEQEADARVAEPDKEEITYKRKKRVDQKDEMLSNLPVETVDYYLPEEEQFCSECGEHLHIMGRDIRRELKIVPAQVKVVEHIQHIYSCRGCEKYSDGTPIVKSIVAEPVIKGSMASPSVVSYIKLIPAFPPQL